ncbi:4-hydroxy-tetrahydrodipicolinate synthase [Aquincola sp. S2]|uniref:4-hydroxy-tetrahydrodipicolinate synthase n=1 Tax=Pseudaquabacterium terrae TaxID=2732868 RepID=A0ABX2EMX7_9BURK|nr:4-hydroxy-tetrahydrodipicolinate synthase [Aquabacterium terrae]NRF69910.1 4-hydroxy-tetrahydrodipicolinate synthase [Aquabacterium terrae]
MVQFSGIWVPLVTPFRSGALDLPALRRLVEQLASHGVAGFVACGSTGEAALLDDDEQQAVLRTVLDAAGDRPVLMGLSGARPALVAARARQLADALPLAGYLLSAPGYMKPNQAGLLDFFITVADVSPVPIVAYDIPSRTGVRIEPQTLLALAAHPRIRALKDCSSDAAAATALLADGRLALLAGNDDELFAQLALGATGSITASAHLRPDLFVRLHRLMQAQRLHEARALWHRLRPLVTGLFAEPNPAPVKALLARQGVIAGELRAPMTPASAACVERAQAALDALRDLDA